MITGMNSGSLRCAACCRWRARGSTSGYTSRYRIARSRISDCLGSSVTPIRSVAVCTALLASSVICVKRAKPAADIAWPGSCAVTRSRRYAATKRRGHIAGRPSILAPNWLNREFTVDAPDRAWVTDITYIRTWQGWLSLAVVMDLHARKVVGRSMKPTLARELVLDALLMAVWRRKPQRSVLVHSDQRTQRARAPTHLQNSRARPRP